MSSRHARRSVIVTSWQGAIKTVLSVTCAAFAWSCGDTGNIQPAERTEAPGPKQAIRALLNSHDVPLTVDDSCANVGSDFGDKTIGDYIAGLLSEFNKTSPTGRNTVSAECRPAPTSSGAWQCSVELGRRDGENEWVRGVEFRILQDGSVQRDSIRCTGGG